MPTGAPEGSDDYFVFVEGVVEMAGHLSQVQASESLDTRGRVGCPSSGEQRQCSQGVIELGGEDLPVVPMLQPPVLLATDVAPPRRREEDTPRRQRDLSSLRISVASARRPASTSASDSRKAV